MPHDATAEAAFVALINDLDFAAFVDDAILAFDLAFAAAFMQMQQQVTEASAREFRHGCHEQGLTVIGSKPHDGRSKAQRDADKRAEQIGMPLEQLLAQRRAA
ncbi:MAG: hypothetical protein KC457_13660 [Myxococcales bacterium]|nr:hypothetical protein [Myxococcales bacterium]